MMLLENIATVVLVSAGALFFLAGTVGLLRFPDAMTRLHALTKADNLGLGLVVLGLLPLVDSVPAALKLVAVWVLTQLAGATVTQLVARAVWREGESSQTPMSATLTVPSTWSGSSGPPPQAPAGTGDPDKPGHTQRR